MAWNLTGSYVETCSCELMCPCNLSFDHGETWSKVNNLPVGQFTTLALDNADPYNIVGGLQDNGVMRGPSTYNPGKSDPAAWRSIFGGDGSAVAIDPKDANVIYTAYQFGNAVRLDLKAGGRAIVPRGEAATPPLRHPPLPPSRLQPGFSTRSIGLRHCAISSGRPDPWGI